MTSAVFAVEAMERRQLLAVLPHTFGQENLVSDGTVPDTVTDVNLINPWGVAVNPNSRAIWVADNGTGRATSYNPDGSKSGPAVVIPAGAGGDGAAPTGVTFNTSASGFQISANGTTGVSKFLFASEDGTISGWNPTVDPDNAVLVVDNSASGAVYTGLAINRSGGKDYLYAANFHDGTIDVFDSNFNPVQLRGPFRDVRLPDGFAPFNVQTVGKRLYVTYARQNEDGTDDVPGAGNGFVDVFRANGRLERRFASGGELNSPWGVIQGTQNFGLFANRILIGNFGDGRINAYNEGNGEIAGTVRDANGDPLENEGLWGLAFGATAATRDDLFFAAGPNDEANGLFGKIVLIRQT